MISLRYPSYAVRHPQPCLLAESHDARVLRHVGVVLAGLSPQGRVKENVRRALIHAADTYLLSGISRAWSHSPPRCATGCGSGTASTATCCCRRLRLDPTGATAMSPSSSWCRGCAPQARRHGGAGPGTPDARHVRCVIAGDGEERATLEGLAAAVGLDDRARLSATSPMTNWSRSWPAAVVSCSSRNEDYGFVTVEAFASANRHHRLRQRWPAELVVSEQRHRRRGECPAAWPGCRLSTTPAKRSGWASRAAATPRT